MTTLTRRQLFACAGGAAACAALPNETSIVLAFDSPGGSVALAAPIPLLLWGLLFGLAQAAGETGDEFRQRLLVAARRKVDA